MADADALRALTTRYAETVSAKDLDAYVAMFTDDAVQGDPLGEPWRKGHAAIREFMGNAFAGAQTMDFTVSDVHTAGDHVGFHFALTVTMEGATMTMAGIETFQVADDGRICEARAYWDERDVSMA